MIMLTYRIFFVHKDPKHANRAERHFQWAGHTHPAVLKPAEISITKKVTSSIQRRRVFSFPIAQLVTTYNLRKQIDFLNALQSLCDFCRIIDFCMLQEPEYLLEFIYC